ncbi:4-hydroxy-tetrahydrodipicolinate reductase [Terasakiella brassicae]|uniref:4-hydroxy-tetrahydrodipicolinate reductase n=1 Tax=Terasakiella brassicae TaxID=1634917 RepID=A0A917C465_9PROT|nr:4-hydroxy-tetrahydrodipicolinate reductase [Terasakiella brassicae]GGF69946.1 4-hydroxy-tetrahydrodipicolinate reductase [Terasakiella brassicae]
MKIGIVGCTGRMGRMLVQAVVNTEGAELAGGTERENSPFIGQDPAVVAGEVPSGAVITANADELFAKADAVIDFTAPTATIEHAKLAAKHGTGLVIGTTGLSADDQAIIAEAAKSTTIIQAPNMSLGVNLAFAITEKVASMLSDDWDIEIVEMHHKHKVDAPSGTALGLGRAAAKGRGVDLDTVADKVRDGFTGERKKGDIGFATLRGGDVVGDHTVMFAIEGERFEITHKASSRVIFARGAVTGALWTQSAEAGLYDMQDVLGLKD